MAGSIRRRGKRTWEVAIRLGKDPVSGRYRRRTMAVVGTKRDAERVLAEAIHQRDTGIDLRPEKLDVASYLRRWLRDYAVHNVAPATFVRYTGIVERHLVPAIGGIRLTALRPAHIQAAYSAALSEGGRADGRRGGLSPRTVLQHHRVLREALRHAELWQLIPRNPGDAVTPPRFAKTEIAALPLKKPAASLSRQRGRLGTPSSMWP